jgi:hypothetical protein
MPTTARFIVLWGAPEEPEAFNRHYEEVHIPLARKLQASGAQALHAEPERRTGPRR